MKIQPHNPDWKWCDPERLQRGVDRSARLEELGATNTEVHYDEREDYVIVDFDMDGHRYQIHTYKIHRLTRDGHSQSALRFDQICFLYRFFESGRHKNWHSDATTTYQVIK